MASKIIEITSPEDLANLDHCHIESLHYENGGNTLVMVVNHVTWPNKVMVTINIGLLTLHSPLGAMMYQPAFVFNTQDILPLGQNDLPPMPPPGSDIIQGS